MRLLKTVRETQDDLKPVSPDISVAYNSVVPEDGKQLKYKPPGVQGRNAKSGGPWASRRMSTMHCPKSQATWAKFMQRTPWQMAKTSFSSYASKFLRCSEQTNVLVARQEMSCSA